jgi:hypothetical protein
MANDTLKGIFKRLKESQKLERKVEIAEYGVRLQEGIFKRYGIDAPEGGIRTDARSIREAFAYAGRLVDYCLYQIKRQREQRTQEKVLAYFGMGA